jgi:ribosomal protein S18 acetylase RimI-like enzyme
VIRISRAGESDLPGLLDVQHEAFARVADEVGFPADEMPPVQETLDDLRHLADQGWRFWKATDGEAIVGTVRAVEHSGAVEIGRLAVASAYVRRGVATALMISLEQGFPDAVAFTLFTGHNAEAPLALYDRLGYAHVRDEVLPNGYTLVWLEKRV